MINLKTLNRCVNKVIFIINVLAFAIITYIVTDPEFFNPTRAKLNALGLSTWFLIGLGILLRTIFCKYINE